MLIEGYAHKYDKRYEQIIEHGMKVSLKLTKEQEQAVKNLFVVIFLDNKQVRKKLVTNKIVEQLRNSLYLHDSGKSTYLFQTEKMCTEDVILSDDVYGGTAHSYKGSLIYYLSEAKNLEYQYNKKLLTTEEYELLYLNILMNAFVIAKHHGKLTNMDDYLFNISKCLLNELGQIEETLMEKIENPEKILNKITNGITYLRNMDKGTVIHFYIRYLRGILSNNDHEATMEFFIDREYRKNLLTKKKKDKMIANYKKSIFAESYLNYKKGHKFSELNSFRNSAVENLIKNLNLSKGYSLDFIEGATGIGKTNLSLIYILNYLDKCKKVIYTTKFNNVSNQTYEEHVTILDREKDLNIESINSSNEIPYKVEQETSDEAYFKTVQLNYDYSFISNEKMLGILFGTSIDDAIALANLDNSILIFDEVQNINPVLWESFSKVIRLLIKCLNCKVMMMSATLPKLTNYISEDVKENNLLDKHYFDNTLMKNRVEICSDLYTDMPDNSIMNNLCEEVLKNKNARQLVQFNTKKSAKLFYQLVKESEQIEDVFIMTGKTSKANREKIINYLNKKNNDGGYVHKKCILIATQLIESGIDIDMEISYKDVSTLDSEEQFKGRTNRNNKKRGKVYFFNYEYTGYLNTNLKNIRLSGKYISQIRLGKHREYFNKIIKFSEIDDDVIELRKDLNTLDFEKAYNQIKINSNTVDFFVLTSKSRKLWEQYNELVQDKRLNYPLKKIKLRELFIYMSEYIETEYLNKKTKNFIKQNKLDIEAVFVPITEDKYEEYEKLMEDGCV